ncbi:PREDICTED: serine/threonine-protein kinase 17B [Cyprinodon variegatus]|uniref:serine/threonine-protein kinase 17B n=1 Tax=Cyprinodon variegatus TaxID=28743 RepID=UPI000742740A|nr:PREDICTED: serine/threonine-protein kinase 17B [Cyprinodon variegatus]
MSRRRSDPRSGLLTETQTPISSEPLENLYEVTGELGRGKFAVVRRCVEKSSGKVFAAKFLRKRRRGRDCRAELIHEMAVLELTRNNPRVVNLYGAHETDHDLVLLLEYPRRFQLLQRRSQLLHRRFLLIQRRCLLLHRRFQHAFYRDVDVRPRMGSVDGSGSACRDRPSAAECLTHPWLWQQQLCLTPELGPVRPARERSCGAKWAAPQEDKENFLDSTRSQAKRFRPDEEASADGEAARPPPLSF